MNKRDLMWPAIGSGELMFIKKFASEVDGKLAYEQLRALWVAYCIHQNMEVDTLSYDTELRQIWNALPDSMQEHQEYAIFEKYMAEHLV